MRAPVPTSQTSASWSASTHSKGAAPEGIYLITNSKAAIGGWGSLRSRAGHSTVPAGRGVGGHDHGFGAAECLGVARLALNTTKPGQSQEDFVIPPVPAAL